MVWKGLIKILQSNPQPCTGHSRNPTLCLRVLSEHSLRSGRLGGVSTALESLFSAWPPSGARTLSCYPASTPLTQLQGCSLGSCHFFRCSLSGEIKATSPSFGGNRWPWHFKYLDYLFFCTLQKAFWMLYHHPVWNSQLQVRSYTLSSITVFLIT